MKFRYKVLFINIILLSIGIGVAGFFMIKKNYELALNSQIKNAIEENNFFQSSIEYEMLGLINSGSKNLSSDINSAITRITSAYNISEDRSELFIIYDNKEIYPTIEGASTYPAPLYSDTKIGSKSYEITHEEDSYYIYVSSSSIVLQKNMHIINRRNISDIYVMINKQEDYFSVLLIIILILLSVFMFVISYLLTKPLERLNKVAKSFGEGNYDSRAKIKTNDEIGALAKTYNQMAEAVETHVKELGLMLEQKDQFVADFTHEIKTPMTSIIGYADTIRSREISREGQIMAATYIFNEGRRLESMSQKLFELLLTKQHKIADKPISTSRLLYEIAESVTPNLNSKDITLQVKESDDYIIHGDIDLLKSAFINLIDNARKASNTNSRIILESEKKDTSINISVTDFGVGISEEHIAKICDEFYMVDKSRSRKEGGAGLGLSLASLIFKRHNAILDIKSKLGEGTTISVEFPTKSS